MTIKANLESTRQRIPSHVCLVAVSKTKSDALILEAYASEQRDFGENYVQELCEKHERLPKDIRWHFIGHLQSNKVKYLAPFVHLIQSVDSVKLLEEINKQAAKCNRVISCLLQIHIAKEETKFGFDFSECRDFLASGRVEQLQNIHLTGFMGMASNTANETQVKNEFEKLHAFALEMKKKYPYLISESFGMSGDFEMAISQGSNMIRVGSLIFGERQKPMG